ncbi:MAG: hydroxyacid dehydrogenase [Saprospiraceae bacterium]|nr:hydroxyacid dehydrogenase [Saprospiraceae bacterium]
MQKFLIIDHQPALFAEGLRKLGFQVDERPGITYTELYDVIENYVGLVISSRLRVDRTFINLAANLRYILRPGSGLENVDLSYAEQMGITCLNSPEGNRDAVAEHAIAMLLHLFNNLSRADREVRFGLWLRENNRGIELMGKTVGIIGYGNTGKALAKKLSGFDVEVLAYDKYKEGLDEYATDAGSMRAIYEQADVVSLHLPLTSETFQIANDAFFRKFRKPIYFINTSRGNILNTSSLINAIERGAVAGACLDVLENEKIYALSAKQQREFNFLRNSDQVILTPHIAGWTHASKIKMVETLLDKFANELIDID